MKIIKFIFYKPYLILFSYLVGSFYYFSIQNPLDKTIYTVSSFIFYMILIGLLFRFLKTSVLRLLNKISIFSKIPDAILSGYIYIFTLFNPIIAIIIAIVAKLFIWENKNEKTYIDEYGNEVTQIKSLTPTVILSRKEQETGELEHIVMSKLKKKPRKIIYE